MVLRSVASLTEKTSCGNATLSPARKILLTLFYVAVALSTFKAVPTSTTQYLVYLSNQLETTCVVSKVRKNKNKKAQKNSSSSEKNERTLVSDSVNFAVAFFCTFGYHGFSSLFLPLLCVPLWWSRSWLTMSLPLSTPATPKPQPEPSWDLPECSVRYDTMQ